MKILKFNESIENEFPQESDYVIMSTYEINDTFRKFVNNNIGQIVQIYKRHPEEEVRVDYNNVPEELQPFFVPYRTFSQSQIVHFAKNKKELEMYIKANKYNL